MKKLITLLIFFSAFSVSQAELDTLTYWNKSGSIAAYNNPAIQMQWAHFYPEAPCDIKTVIVWFYGNAGTANIYIAGQEAGSSVPSVVSATNKVLWGQNGVQFDAQSQTAVANIVNIEPNVHISGNQFFVGFTGIAQGMYLATDQETYSPWCESSNGGTYLYQALLVNDGQQTGWSLGEHAYAIDVIVDYPRTEPAYHLFDMTEDYGLPTDMSKKTIAAADYDDDGYIDLLVKGRLFKNDEGNFFEEKTSEAGLSGNPSGNAFLDMDNDGDLDILFLMQGEGNSSKLYKNNGDGTFEEKELSIPDLYAVTCFSIADVNGDKYPDLFIGQLWSAYPEPELNYFFLNDGADDFTDNTTALYPNYDGTWNYPDEQWDPDAYKVDRNRNSRGSQFVDYDNDGDLDLYVTNYFLQWDEFYENKGDGSFEDIIDEKGIDVNDESGHNHGTGVDWFDYDNDGDMDLLLSQFAHPRFLQFDHRPLTVYKNTGAPSYNFQDTYDSEEKKSTIGLTYEETYAGAAWGDPNNDGLADIITTTFYGCRFINFFQQTSDHTFLDRTFEYGMEGNVTGEDAVWLDFDNDGKLDLAMSENREFRLFKNIYDLNYDWLEVDLKGKEGQEKYIIGARVKVHTSDKTFTQEVSCGRGQKMQKPFRLHFGLGSGASIEKVEVRWPGETEYEEFYGMQKNSVVKLIQDQGGEPEVPDIPSLASPADGAEEVDINAETLVWNKITVAENYEVNIALDSEFSNIIEQDDNVNDTTYSIANLEGETEYYWRVRATNFIGSSDWSETWSFTTAASAAVPSAPVLIAPEDAATEVSIRSDKFEWESVETALEYNLQASFNEDFSTIDYEITTNLTEFALSDLEKETEYYWKVRAKNNAGYGEWSGTRSLTTDDSRPLYPDAPELIFPENNAENVPQSAKLQWEHSNKATAYHIQIATSIDFSDDLVDEAENWTKTEYPIAHLDGETNYHWQVKAKNSRGASDMWSMTRKFTTGVFSGIAGLSSDYFEIISITPNPMSQSAVVNFKVGKAGFVELKIFSVTGEEIQTLVAEEKGIGEYIVNWNPKSLKSGVYYCRLSAGEFFDVKKLVVIK